MIAAGGDILQSLDTTLSVGRRRRRRRIRGTLLLVLLALQSALVGYASGNAILAFTGLYVAVAVVPFLGSISRPGVDVFRPFVGLAVLLYLYAISTPLFIRTAGVSYYGDTVAADNLATYYIACLLAISGLSLGTILAGRAGRCRPSSFKEVRYALAQRRLLLVTAGIMGLVALPFIAGKFNPVAATNYAEVALSLRVDRLADRTAGLKETLFEVVPSTLVLCAATVLMADKFRRLPLRLAAGVVFTLYVLTSALSGWRGQMMVAILIFAVYFHYRVRAIRLSEALLGSIAVYVLINALSVMRASSYPLEMIEILLDVVSERGWEFLALGKSGELATSSNLLRLITGIKDGEASFGLGGIAFGQLAAFIPRAFFPNRPDFANDLFVKVFYPHIFESGGGYGLFMVQDGYWDFGNPGVLLYCTVFAYGLERMYMYLRERFVSDLAVFLYALLFSQLVLSVVRSGIFVSIKGALITALPIYLLLGISYLPWSRTTSRCT